jgi:formiminotetrahydrofolate cyclodeaminase
MRADPGGALMTQLSRMTVQEILQAAGSTAPSPGAGSVMALAGAWGAALALKAIRITEKHNKGSEATRAAEPELERLAQLLLEDAQDDATGFEAYVQALRRPKSDPDRQAAVGQASAATAQTAVRTLEHTRAAIGVCASVKGGVAPVVAADLDAALALLRAAGRTARQDAKAGGAGPHGPRRGQFRRPRGRTLSATD